MPRYVLETVQDYIADARVLLLDQIFPYRYDDTSLLVALNLSLQHTRFLRPDLFVHMGASWVPSYDSVSGQEVPIEPQFRRAVVYGLVGHALMRDQEDVQDQRATTFLQTQETMLLGRPLRPPVQGATTPQGNPGR